MWVPAGKAAHDAAVLDVGSNSVRLVIYRLEGRAIWTVFNEKVLAGLGRGVATTGRLSIDGVGEALSALRRFKAVLDAARPAAVYAVATAAVREASDGADFIRRVEAETGLTIRVLSGEEEARYSALGVIAGAPDAEGVAGDLGGSSLELIRVSGGRAEGGVTLPLGPFALGAPRGFDAEAVRRTADQRLGAVADDFSAPVFHAVGGAWRNLALIWMRMTSYPLQVVHQFALNAREATEVAKFVSKQSRGSLERIPGVSKKRVETLPYAAVVLESLIHTLGVQTVSLSAYGVREGLLFEAMDPDTRARDPLVEGCAALGARQGVAEGLGEALAPWVSPTLESLPGLFTPARRRVMIQAAARLADIGARLHPDHRADLAFAQVLRAPIAGQTHVERAFLATAVYARYGGSGTPESQSVRRILDEDQIARARAFGLALRLGCDLSARTPRLLEATRLEVEGGKLVLTAPADQADILLGEQTTKRAGALAQALGLVLETRKA